MDKIDVLLNLITLLYMESLNNETRSNISIPLANDILNIIEDRKFSGIKKTKPIVTNLTHVVSELVKTKIPDVIDKEMLLQSMSLVMKEEPETLYIFKDSVNIKSEDVPIKIVRLSRMLRNYKTEHDVKKALQTFSFDFTKARQEEPNISAFIDRVKNRLTELDTGAADIDPHIVDELDVGDGKSIGKIIDKVKEENEQGGKLIAGWQALNRMTQGGFRGGEFVTVTALQHQYKTGFTLSSFLQMCVHNTPKLLDLKKKPLMLWISFEDDVKNIIQFAFNYLYYMEEGKVPDINDFSSDFIETFVTSRLTAQGFHVKILRVNPTGWTYKDIMNKTTQYENEGYEVKVLGLDYLSMIPTIGCISTGPMGTDLRDLFRRVRNFYSARKTLVITPHQMSSDAKRLTRNGVPDASLVKEVAGKGYYSGSTQLDQEIDLELFIHKTKANGATYLTVQRGKHRLPTNIPDKYMYFLLKFPETGPIPGDIGRDDSSMESLSNINDGAFGL